MDLSFFVDEVSAVCLTSIWLQVDTTKVKAVAVNGKDNETFVGIARMMPMQFVQHATGTGGFGIFLQNES